MTLTISVQMIGLHFYLELAVAASVGPTDSRLPDRLNRDGGDIAKRLALMEYMDISPQMVHIWLHDELESNERVCQQEWTHFFCECGAGI